MTAVVRAPTHAPVRTMPVSSALVLQAAHGRLYASGRLASKLTAMNGAHTAKPKRRGDVPAVELTLTLETLRTIRALTNLTSQQLATCMSPPLLAWAKAAGNNERVVNAMHARLNEGWRASLPWIDRESGLAPWAHQQVMASVAVSIDGCAFLCEMGTGKSRAAAEAMAYHTRRGMLKYHIVVSPKKSLRMTWLPELRRWTNELHGVLLDGSPTRKSALLKQAQRGDLPAGTTILINYESLSGLRDEFASFMQAQPVGLVLDEMHKIKNPGAHRTKAAMEMARYANWRLGMTGSPILQGVQDVWSQWYIVDLGVTFGANFVSYKREFMEEVNYFAPHELNGKRELYGEVGLRMRRRGLRYTKKECMDLPPKVYERQQIEMSTEQARAYAEMAEMLIAQLRTMGAGNWTPEQLMDGDSDVDTSEGEKVATASTQLVAMLRLSQITSGFVPDENGEMFRFGVNPKLDALEEIVDENIEQQQIIVWCRYREDVRAIGERLARYRPVVLWGGGNKAAQDEAVRGVEQFQRGERRLLVAIAASGGESLNLQAASLAVYYSQDFSLGARLQSEDRCHRGGSEQHNAVTYIDLMCTDTVDEIVAAALKDKKTVSDLVIDLRDHIGFTGD